MGYRVAVVGATGNVGPNLGPGLWIITQMSNFLELEMNIYPQAGGPTIECYNARTISFVTPGQWTVPFSSGTARSYRYVFYRMAV